MRKLYLYYLLYMATSTILIILLLFINCEFDPYQQRVEPKDIEKIILEKLSRDKDLNRRELSTGFVKYIDPTSILTISNEYIFEVFTIRIKAEGGDISSIHLPNVYDKTSILWYSMEIKNENEEIIPLDNHINNCSINEYNNLYIHTNLSENYELYIKIKMRHTILSIDNNFLFQKIMIYIPPNYNGAICKYIIQADPNSIIVGWQNDNKFAQLNSSAYIYHDICPSSYYYDILRLTPYQVTWNIYNEITMSIIEIPSWAFISVQKSYFGGSNYNFTKNELLTSIKENDTLKIDTFYDLTLRNFQKKEGYFKLNLTFSSSPVFWNVTLNDFKNTSTNETISLAKEILENDLSTKPDYYKIGKWVYNNIKYNISYSGKTLSINKIIELKQGVCHHYTILYNSLLNSIGIETVYAAGYSVKNISKPTDGRHGWTVAKIDGKWIGLDATWGIFSGYLPLCHLFQDFESSFLPTYFNIGGKVDFNEKEEEVKFVEIVNFNCDLPYLNINRNCKLCKEIDNNYPYYDFNSGECVNKCTKVNYNSICYDNCQQIDNKNRYVKNENNECTKIDSKDSSIYTIKKSLLFLISLFLLF